MAVLRAQPKCPDKTGAKYYVGTRLSPELYKRIEDSAYENRISVSWVVAKSLEKEFGEKKTEGGLYAETV